MKPTETNSFKQALVDSVLREYSNIPYEDEINAKFFENIEKRCPPPQTVHRKTTQCIGKVIKRCILIAAIIAALALTALAFPAVRKAAIKFFTSNEGTHFSFNFDREKTASAPKSICQVYRPTYVPDGFYVDTVYVGPDLVTYIWRNNAGEYIAYDQMPIPKSGEGPSPDAEDVTTQMLYLNGYNVFCVSADVTGYYWTDHAYFYSLYFGPSVSETDRNKVFCSIAPDPAITNTK